jgi:hypothetical protein
MPEPPSQFDQLVKYAPILLVACIVLGGVYNLGVVGGGLRQNDYFYLLTYLDHINSAVVSAGIVFFVLFLVYAVWSIVSPAGAKAAALLRLDRLKFSVPARLIAVIAIAAVLVVPNLLKMAGITQAEATPAVVVFVLFIAAGLLLLKFLANPEPESAVLMALCAVTATFSLGGIWVEVTRANTGPFLIVETDKPLVVKGVKAFSEFALAIDRDNNTVVLRSKDIKKITVMPSPPAEAPAPARPQQGGGQRR